MLVKEQLHLVEILKYLVMLCKESRALWAVVKGLAELRKTQAQRELSTHIKHRHPSLGQLCLAVGDPGSNLCFI